ncbi:hypothetical protein [Herbaspirillum lusitanum]|uniref:hypothetical protein n=1 Tax=Herbaspirillum lusitanum TaxID=213312 RepID=UPI00031A25A5|nr:hypothetical protein [Herbaspirillum lusitanum]
MNNRQQTLRPLFLPVQFGTLSVLVSAALGLSLVSAPACATAEYALQSGVSWYRIDNPFMFPSNSDNKLKTSDSAWSTDIRGALFLPLPTERTNLQLTASVSQMHYGSSFGNYTDLNGNGPYNLNQAKKQFQGMYTWEYSDLLRGRVRHRTDDRLYNYFGGEIAPSTTTPPRGISNIEPEFPHIREDEIEVAYRVTNRFDVPLTWTQQTLSYTVPGRVEMYNMNSNAVQAAIRYTSGIKSTLSAGVRRNRVGFSNRTAQDIADFDSGYTDTEFFTDTAWRYTENTIFIAHLGSIARHFKTLPNRDSRLVSGELGIDWHYSPKTTFYGRIWDRPQANEEADSRLYVITKGVQGRVVWQATPKTRVSLLASLESQKSQNFATARISTPTSGDDQQLRLGFRYDYDITRRLALRVDAIREQTTSKSGGNIDYRRSTVQVSLNYTFDNITGPFNFDNQQGYNRARQQIEDLR